MQTKNIILFLFLLCFSLCTFSQKKFEVSGGTGEPYIYTADLAGTEMDKVCLFNGLYGARLSYTSSSLITFYRYQQNRANSEVVPDGDITQMSVGGGATQYTIANLKDGWGYYFKENDNKGRVTWIIDYDAHKSTVTSISIVEDEDKCENLKLIINKNDDLHFYLPGGVKRDIRTTYTLSYNTLGWESDSFVDSVAVYDNQTGPELIVKPPLKDTRFILEGDQFAVHFNLLNRKIESDLYEAVAVQAHIVSEKGDNSGSGNISSEEAGEDGKLEGAAPLDIRFYGNGKNPIGTDVAAYYYIWNIYRSNNMESPIVRYTDRDISYRFEQSGEYRVVLEVADRTSFCASTQSVTVRITESYLDIPNFFSPGDSPGSNDEFRVAYKSLVRFKCTIFNRWGVKLYEWTDPARGWDGRYRGNYVKPGVYYYVIDAEGSDGIKYKRAAAINILRSK